MGSNAPLLTGLGGGGKAAVIGGAAAALLSTGTATAANITPTHLSAATVSYHNHESRHNNCMPRAGGGRDSVQLGPCRTTVAGRLVPGRPSLDHVTAR